MQGQKDKKIWGARLKEAFRARGIKAVDVAQKLGVQPNTISQWFMGRREPRLDILYDLLVQFGINPVYVLTGEGSPLLDWPSSPLPLDMRKKKHLRRRGNFVNRILNFACC